MASGRLYSGTSGFAYPKWKPGFYPARLKSAQMLEYYAGRLPSVEVNNTFYRTPTPALLEGWRDRTPPTFIFSLKAPRRITHVKRLRDADEAVGFLLGSVEALGSRLGCLLFQCPPNLRYEADRLDAFLSALPKRHPRIAMEFRHESWAAPEVTRKLSARGIARCLVDDGSSDPANEPPSADFVYWRLRRPRYSKAALVGQAKRLAPVLAGGVDAYVYFKHEEDPSGVRYAMRLLDLAG